MATKYHPVAHDNEKDRFLDLVREYNPQIHQALLKHDVEFKVYDMSRKDKTRMKLVEGSTGELQWKKPKHYLCINIERFNYFNYLCYKEILPQDLASIYPITEANHIGTYNNLSYAVHSGEISIDSKIYLTDNFLYGQNATLREKAADAQPYHKAVTIYPEFDGIVMVSTHGERLLVRIIDPNKILVTYQDKTAKLWYMTGEKYIDWNMHHVISPAECYLMMKVSTVSSFVSGQVVCSSKYGQATVKGVLFDAQKKYANKILINIGENLLVADETDIQKYTHK